MTFGEFIKSKREEKQWKQPQAAAKIEIEQSYLSKLENDKAIPSAEIFERLMSQYGFSIADITSVLHEEEINKLKDISEIRQFVLASRESMENNKRNFLIGGTVCLTIGAFLFALGMVMQGHTKVKYIYESKGIIGEGESIYLFADLPTHSGFMYDMEFPSRAEKLEAHPLFERLSYKQNDWDRYRGSFYDEKVDGGIRRYAEVNTKQFNDQSGFYLGVSSGSALMMCGFALFFVSRQWGSK